MTQRLRLLVHAPYDTTDSAAAGSRAGAVVDWLARRGHAVAIVDGPGRAGRRVSLARRVRDLSLSVGGVPTLHSAAKSFRPDLVAAVNPSKKSASAVLSAARMADVPAWLHLEDGTPPLGLEPGFACISLASLTAEEELARRGVGQTQALALAPWVDTAAIVPCDAPGPLRAAFARAPDDIVALYVGSLVDERVARILIDAARQVPTRGAVLFVAAVQGPAARLLTAAASELPRLRVLRLPQPHELSDLLGAADIHLLPMGADAAEPLLPAKLASLLASGRPIVTAAPAAPMQRALDQAMTITAPTGEALAAAVVGLAARPAERTARGLAARRAAEEYFAKERVLRLLERRLLALALRAAA